MGNADQRGDDGVHRRNALLDTDTGFGPKEELATRLVRPARTNRSEQSLHSDSNHGTRGGIDGDHRGQHQDGCQKDLIRD